MTCVIDNLNNSLTQIIRIIKEIDDFYDTVANKVGIQRINDQYLIISTNLMKFLASYKETIKSNIELTKKIKQLIDLNRDLQIKMYGSSIEPDILS